MRASIFAVVAALGGGCTNACPNGPACESDWPAAAIAIHQWQTQTTEVDVRDDAARMLQGDDTEGSDWRVRAAAGSLWIGMPEVNKAKQVDPETGETLKTWSALEGRFGAQMGAITLGDRSLFAVSAPEWNLQTGQVAVFDSSTDLEQNHLEDALIQIVGQDRGDHFGETLAVCGDLTGDGYPDLAVSVPWIRQAPETDDTIEPLAGAVSLLLSENLRQAEGVTPWKSLGPTWWGVDTGDAFGKAFLCDVDINADGFSDLVIGAPFSGPDEEGRVYGIYGGELPPGGPIDAARDFEIQGTGASSWAGDALATLSLAETNEIGIVVGEPGYNQGRGRAFLTTASLIDEAPISPKYLYVIRGSSEAGGAMHFGRGITAGDTDGDGLDDLIIGAPDYRYANRSDAGRAWIYLGAHQTDWAAEASAEETASGTIMGSEAFQRVGLRVQIADVDDDSRGDILLPIRASSP